MQYIIVLASLLSLTFAAPTTLDTRAGVCGGVRVPVCCQLDVLGLSDLNCANAGPVATTAEFKALCAQTGTTAQCCVGALGTNALFCTGA
ncbi:hypothetical protein CC86DRAFT_402740 [Ophiobolus disseminans]|uniref:Hydrophobin n=1 Tax=Ophiobolus disseminans TaxID=1469910 RepID=A0A6A7ABN1_9PLEO|nr:hypothetical protein CC86DRAFT_402740 [Ophiobolus disseminans]